MKYVLRSVSVFSLVLVISSCNHHTGVSGNLTIKWSARIDSLLHDTVKCDRYVDSLKALVLQAQSDTAAINLINKLAKEYYDGTFLLANEAIKQSQNLNYPYGVAEGYYKKGMGFAHKHNKDSAFAYLDKSIELAKKINSAEILCLATGLKGYVYTGQNDFEKALQYNKDALKIAQDNNLKDILPYTLTDVGDVYTYIDDFNNSLHYDTLALPLLKASPDKKSYADCLESIGQAYGIKTDYSRSMNYFKQSLKTFEEIKYSKGVASVTTMIANIYYLQENFPEALNYYNKALEIGKKINNKSRISVCLSNIGLVYSGEHDSDNARSYYKQALEIAREISDKRKISDGLNSLGGMYLNSSPDTALNYFNEALTTAMSVHDAYQVEFSYSNIAGLYYHKKNYDSAIVYFNRAIEMAKKIQDNIRITDSYRLLAHIYFEQNNLQKAKQYAELSLEVAKQGGTPDDNANAFYMLSTVEEKLGDYKKALELHKSYASLNDSLNNNEQRKKFSAMEVKAKEDQLNAEQEKKEAVFAAEGAKKEAELKRQKTLSYAVTGGFILLLLFAIIVYRNLQENKKKTKIISEQKQEVEKQKLVVEQKNKEIVDSITYAKRLQDAILPPLADIKRTLPESFVLYKPKDIVAGDFYWMERSPTPSFPIREGEQKVSPNGGDLEGAGIIFIAACDCTGHGVPGAMVSVVCSTALNRAVKEFGITEPGKILDKARALVLETFEKSEGEVKDGMDISLASLSPLTPGEGQGVRLQWAGAYNSLWYLQDGELKEIPGDKQPIGKTDNPKPFTTHTITLNPLLGGKGTALYLFTDGYADQFGGEKGKKFKYKQLQQLILDNAQLPMEEQGKKLEQKLEEWKGSLEQVDDILIIGIRA